MAATFLSRVEPHWWTAVALASLGHVGAMAMILSARSEAEMRLPEPVMVVELPEGAPAAIPSAPEPVSPPEPQQPLPTRVAPPIAMPEVEAPLPPDPLTLPTPRPIARNVVASASHSRPTPLRAAPARAAFTAPPAQTTGTGNVGGGPGDAEAQQAQGDWYALVSAHLNHNKRYPREAKKAEQQGTPVVRFSVDRRGRVSDVSIRTSSGHELLDSATLELMQRVSPLPAMPRSMARESVTITLPIEYSLSRK